MGTDCSGSDAPLIALRAVQLPYGFRHQFSSEVDTKKRSFLKANFPGVVVHHDMLKRDHAQLPHIDVYVSCVVSLASPSVGCMSGAKDSGKSRPVLFVM